ncbi:MAG: VRR-NUC domain-containing protein [Methylococcaceae bacterium]
MANNETFIQNTMLPAISHGNVRVFRNNVGALKTETGQLVRFGLEKSSSDLIGFRSIKITPDMVGKTIAQFVSIEIKTEKGKPTDGQKRWLDMILKFGGIAGIARSIDEAKELLKGEL